MSFIKKKLSWIASLEQALLGVVTTAIPITFVNASGGLLGALKAGGVQGLLTFFTIFVNTSIFQYYYCRNKKVLSIAVPTILTTTLSFLAHTYSGSPEPLWSAVVVFLMGVWFFSLLAYFSKRFKTISVIKLTRALFKEIMNYLKK